MAQMPLSQRQLGAGLAKQTIAQCTSHVHGIWGGRATKADCWLMRVHDGEEKMKSRSRQLIEVGFNCLVCLFGTRPHSQAYNRGQVARAAAEPRSTKFFF